MGSKARQTVKFHIHVARPIYDLMDLPLAKKVHVFEFSKEHIAEALKLEETVWSKPHFAAIYVASYTTKIVNLKCIVYEAIVYHAAMFFDR